MNVTFTYTNGQTSLPVPPAYAAELREVCGSQHLLTSDGFPHCPREGKPGDVLTVAPSPVISSAVAAPGIGPLLVGGIVLALFLLNLLSKGKTHARNN